MDRPKRCTALCSPCNAAIVRASRRLAESRGLIQQQSPRQPWSCAGDTNERLLRPLEQLRGESVPYAPPSPRVSFSRTSSHGIVSTEPASNSCIRRRISASHATSTRSRNAPLCLTNVQFLLRSTQVHAFVRRWMPNRNRTIYLQFLQSCPHLGNAARRLASVAFRLSKASSSVVGNCG